MQVHQVTSQSDTVTDLSDLMQLDMDAIEAYEQALKNIKTPTIHKDIEGFKQDHERHVEELSDLIIGMGGEPPERGKDLKGFFIKAMTAIRSAIGEETALKAMKSNEELTNKIYSEMLEHPLEDEARTLIEKNYKDEKRHLTYIKAILK